MSKLITILQCEREIVRYQGKSAGKTWQAVKRYIEFNPDPEKIVSEIKRLEESIKRIDDAYPKWSCPKHIWQESKKRAKYNEETSYNTLKNQLKMLKMCLM